MTRATRPCVLVFAGLDPSGGAGMQADIEAIGGVGAHALPIITALTVQDNDRVFAVNPVDPAILRHQAQVLADKIPIAAVKIGIVGNRANAAEIADLIRELRQRKPELPVVLDTVLGSGHGYALSDGGPERALAPLISLATLITPNLLEATRLCPDAVGADEQAQHLLSAGSENVLIKGGHGDGSSVTNRWFAKGIAEAWNWPRLPGEFHGSGCTLASAIAGLLAKGLAMYDALERGQSFCQEALSSSYAIAPGQRMPNRRCVLRD